MNPDWSGRLNKEVFDKRTVRSGQLRVWDEKSLSVPVGWRPGGTFLVVGFKEWDDADPTVVILDDGVIVDDYYVSYVDAFSNVVQEASDDFGDVFFSVGNVTRLVQ